MTLDDMYTSFDDMERLNQLQIVDTTTALTTNINTLLTYLTLRVHV